MLEVLNSLTPEAVIAILGSLVTITLGVLALAKQLKNNKSPESSTPPEPTPDSDLAKLRKQEVDQIHSRISSAKDIAMENKGELRVLASHLEALSHRMEEHERRDIEDFKVVQQKIDKVMDIVIQILQDDKL